MKKKISSSRIHIVMPDWLIEAIKKEADKKGITQSDFIRDTMKVRVEQKADAD